MSARSFSPANSMDKVGLAHRCRAVTTTNGTLSTASTGVTPAATCGFTIAKSGVGQYTLTFQDKRLKFGGINATVGNDTPFAPAKGLLGQWKNDDMAVNNNDGTIEVVFLDPATSAPAEVQDASSLAIVVTTYK